MWSPPKRQTTDRLRGTISSLTVNAAGRVNKIDKLFEIARDWANGSKQYKKHLASGWLDERGLHKHWDLVRGVAEEIWEAQSRPEMSQIHLAKIAQALEECAETIRTVLSSHAARKAA